MEIGWSYTGSKTPELVYQSQESEHRYRRAAQTLEEITEALGARLPREDDEGRTRADIHADIDEVEFPDPVNNEWLGVSPVRWPGGMAWLWATAGEVPS